MAKSNVVPINSKNRQVRKGLRMMFGEASDKILDMLQQDDTEESGLLLAQKQMFLTTLSMIPDAERAVKESAGKHGIYQYVQLTQLAQTQIETIKAQMDVSLVADSICANAVHPTFLSLVNHVITSMMRMRNELGEYVSKEDRKEVGRMINDTIRGIGAYMEEQNKELQAKIRQRISDF